jgi:hypothetical protein
MHKYVHQRIIIKLSLFELELVNFFQRQISHHFPEYDRIVDTAQVAA